MSSEDTKAIIDALVRVIDRTVTDEGARAQERLLNRVASAGGVIPSRLPAAQNITEVGGYLNLLAREGEETLRAQVLASALGVAGPEPEPTPTPPLFWRTFDNHRPDGSVQPSIPIRFSVRSDFADDLEAVRVQVNDHGASLPFLDPSVVLPATTPPTSELLGIVGRELTIVAQAALVDPDADPIALARRASGGPLQSVARVIDAMAPLASTVAVDSWIAWVCDAVACAEDTGDRTYLEIAPLMSTAGWYPSPPSVPTNLSNPGDWARWRNVTGLTVGQSTFGEELRLLYTAQEIAASALRDVEAFVWNGLEYAVIS